MKLSAVMDELAAVAGQAPGLHTYGWPVDEATPPAAWPTYPQEMDPLAAFRQGTVRWRAGLWVAVGKVWDRATRDQLSAYTADDGPESIVALFLAHDWQACSYAAPVRWTFDAVTIGAVEMMAALLELDIAGPGLQEG